MVFLNPRRLLIYLVASLTIFTAVFNENEMAHLKEDINDKLNVIGYNDHCLMTVNGVDDAVARINSDKHNGYLGLFSNHVKQVCHEFYVHLSMMFTSLIVHGSTTDDLSSSTVLPIPKGKNLNYSDSTTYSGIALSSIQSWLIDCFTAHQHRKAISAKKRCQIRYDQDSLTIQPHDTSVQKATSDNEDVDAV